MRLSMLLPPDPGTPAEVGGLAAGLERAGLDLLWVAEPYGFDAPTMLGYLTAWTSTMELGAGIMPVYSRTPTLTAMTAAGWDRLSQGRAVLGLGASGPQVIEGWHGVPYDRPVTRTREVIDICRAVWRRERLEYQGTAYTVPLPPGLGTGLGKPLKLIPRPFRSTIPIYVAALGDKNVELAAEAADGWLPLFYAPSRAQEVWGASLDAGRARRSPELGPLEVCAGGLVAIGEDAQRHREAARPPVALYVGGMGAEGRNFYHDLLARYGYEKEADEIQRLFLSGDRAAAEAAIPDRFLEEITLCGPRPYVEERLAEFRESGVTVFNAEVVGPDPVDTIGQLRTMIDR